MNGTPTSYPKSNSADGTLEWIECQVVFDLASARLALREGARGEYGANRGCGKRLDEHVHWILSFE